MAKKQYKIGIFLLLIVIPGLLNAFLSKLTIQEKELIEEIEFGRINWTKGIATVFGEKDILKVTKNEKLIRKKPDEYALNLPNARNKAKNIAYMTALRNMNNGILNIKIRNDLTLKSIITDSSNNDNKDYFNKLALNQIIPEYIYKDNSIQVKLRIKIYDEVFKEPETDEFVWKPIKPSPNPRKEFPDISVISLFTNIDDPNIVSFLNEDYFNAYKEKVLTKKMAIPQSYSSLIIDASEIKGLKPALFPTLYNESRMEIYSSRILNKKTAAKRGIVTYIGDISKINDFPFVDSKTFVIKAVRKTKTTDLILPSAELKQFFSHKETIYNLQKCNILIIINN